MWVWVGGGGGRLSKGKSRGEVQEPGQSHWQQQKIMEPGNKGHAAQFSRLRKLRTINDDDDHFYGLF